jgi:hypothetical protein
MKDGPVPSRTYDMLKHVRGDGYYSSSPAFIKTLGRALHFVNGITIHPIAAPMMDNLSVSDLKAVDNAIGLLGALSFSEIKKLSHDSAYDDADESNNIPMDSVAKAGGADDSIVSYLNTWVENHKLLVA